MTERAPAPAPCWRTIGVGGDLSCVALRVDVHCHNCPVFTRAAEHALHRSAAVDERAAAAVAEPVVRPLRGRSALAFRVGAHWLALELAWVRQIAPTARPHAVPHRAGSGLAGLVNVQGQLLLAVDLRMLLGDAGEPAPSSAAARPRLVVVQLDGDAWAFGADDVPGVMTLPELPSAQPPSTLRPPLAELAAGLFDREDGHLVLLRPDALRATMRRAVPA